MKKNSKEIKKGLKFINQIQSIRSKNNKNWMDLMRLSFKENPKETIKIVKGIFKEDTKISKLIKHLTKS